MNRSFSFFCLLISIVVIIDESNAATLIVPNQYQTINAAVQAASTGDLIFINPGEYNETVKWILFLIFYLFV
jgi:pectin methylesterase-like acyl-CoA thioesterase